LNRVLELSEDILGQFSFDPDGNSDLTGNGILTALDTNRFCPTVTLNQEGRDIGCACDELLREFHRYDEDLSVQGKWGGGSVTGVCRGWGTSRVRH